MRKQSDSNLPELNRDSRLINSTIRSAKYKRPNALLARSQKNTCAPIKSTIWSKNFRVKITNQHQNGPKPSRLKSFQVYCRPSPNSRRLNWVTGPTSWSRQCANGEPTNK
jgi:hypothetical protein